MKNEEIFDVNKAVERMIRQKNKPMQMIIIICYLLGLMVIGLLMLMCK